MPKASLCHRPRSAAERTVNTRRIAFTFNRSSPRQRHFVTHDIAMSHLVALLSGFFPSGEEFFIQSVRRYGDQIADPVLKKQVAGFIGQEMTHGIQHRNLNNQLVRRGYWATWLLDTLGSRLVKIMKSNRDRIPDKIGKFALAVTAAVEHLTAVLGEQVLTSSWVQEQLTDPEVRAMLNWHAIEEMEHKAVAFDVYRHVGGKEWLRIVAMAITLALQSPAITGLGGTPSKPCAASPLCLIALCSRESDPKCRHILGSAFIPMISSTLHFWRNGGRNILAQMGFSLITSNKMLHEVFACVICKFGCGRDS
jgi:predicted metal-dependent hydrolase